MEWEEDEDGTADDMWRNLWKCIRQKGYKAVNNLTFLDEQFGTNLEVAAAQVT